MNAQQGSGSERPRPAPAERFAGDEHVYDLAAAAEQLRRQAPEARHGHRQVTLLKHPRGTVSLFDWEPGGELAEHQANGYVTIQCVRGRLTVTTATAAHDLSAGRMLVMHPGVRHAVRAEEASQMLLTVNLV